MFGGVAGAVIGFAIGTIDQTTQIIRDNVQSQEQQSLQIMQMENQLNFTRSRIGWSTKCASIGADL